MSEAIKAALRVVNTDVVPKIQSLALVAARNATELLIGGSNVTASTYNSSSTQLTDTAILYPLSEFTDSNETKFKALQYSLFTTSFVEVLGGLFFLITAAYILRDKARAEKAVSGMSLFIIIFS